MLNHVSKMGLRTLLLPKPHLIMKQTALMYVFLELAQFLKSYSPHGVESSYDVRYVDILLNWFDVFY